MFGPTDIQPIGLDIGHDSVKMLQVEVRGNSLAVRALARRPLELSGRGEAALDAALAVAAQTIKRGPFVGRHVVAALPRDIVHLKNLRLPMIPAAELPAAIKFEARNIFTFDTDAARCDYIAAGEVRQGADTRQEVIVIAARNSDIDGYIERLDRFGLIVDSLDVEPCALYRSVERFIRRRDDEQEVNVLLDVGLRRTQVIIGRGREMSFLKPIDIGGQRLNESVSRKLGISPEEARVLRRHRTDASGVPAADMALRDSVRQAVFNATRVTLEELGHEVSLCLRYYSVTFRGPGPQKVRLMGGEAHDPYLASVLTSVLSIPAEPAAPLFNVDCSAIAESERQGPMSEWSTALGLALKKAPGPFAARDGKPRQGARLGIGEVIDINKAIAGAESSGADGKSFAEAASA
ncbi:MAG TPA: pilus assembly protein PilM [Tepidisphaeraceae bacterium]|nr:pilus assembly protein PilM [Tepidisphaeraceae bacterium]